MVVFLSEKNRFPMFSIGWIMVTGSILAQQARLVGGKWERCRGDRYCSRGERGQCLLKEAPWRHKIYASTLMSVEEEGIIMQGQLQGCALLSGKIRSLATKDKEGRNDRVNENPTINPFRLSSPWDERWSVISLAHVLAETPTNIPKHHGDVQCQCPPRWPVTAQYRARVPFLHV